jgi:hypothetical protein
VKTQDESSSLGTRPKSGSLSRRLETQRLLLRLGCAYTFKDVTRDVTLLGLKCSIIFLKSMGVIKQVKTHDK